MKYSLAILILANIYSCTQTAVQPSNTEYTVLKNCEVEEIVPEKTYEIICQMSLTSSQAVVSKTFEQAAHVAQGYNRPFFKVIKTPEKVQENQPKVTGLLGSGGIANATSMMTIEILEKKEPGIKVHQVKDYL